MNAKELAKMKAEIMAEIREDVKAEVMAEVKAKKDSGLIPVWRKDGKDYGASIIELPTELLESALKHDGKLWINVFQNKYWTKKKGKKNEQPMFKLAFNEYRPNKS